MTSSSHEDGCLLTPIISDYPFNFPLLFAAGKVCKRTLYYFTVNSLFQISGLQKYKRTKARDLTEQVKVLRARNSH